MTYHKINGDPVRVVALAGGVGGAKFAYGLAKILDPGCLTVIVNTGDDFIHQGLYISPDVDTVVYTLAGLANEETGWGLENETWNVLEALQRIGSEVWFKLGDKDIATHMFRTSSLAAGKKLSEVTAELCQRWKINQNIIPMTDDIVRTVVITKDGESIPFQEYFVKRHFKPAVEGFIFESIENAEPSHGIKEKIMESDLVIICPSNPFVSINPIIEVNGIRNLLINKEVIGISPIIGGKALKGPAAKMFSDFGSSPSALAVALHYKQFIKGFVIDNQDSNQKEAFSRSQIVTFVTDIVMRNKDDRIRLAKESLDFALKLFNIRTS